MTTKAKVIATLVLLSLSFAFGRYSVQGVKTTETVQVVDKKKIERDKHKKTTTVVVELPDGTKRTETVVTDDSTTKIDESTVSKDVKTSTPVKRNTLSVSALAGVDVTSLKSITYGVAVNKEVLGPITVGAWGLTSGTVGVSLGVNF